MVAQVLIFLPAVANFRKDWLGQRLIAAKIASLAVEASGGAELPKMLRDDLLMTAGVRAVSLRRPNSHHLVLAMPENAVVSAVFDMRQPSILRLIAETMDAFWAAPGRLVRVIGAPDMMPDSEIEIVIDETPLKRALWAYAANVLSVSLAISLSVAILVYLALNALLVGPMMRFTQSMMAYRENPEDASRIIQAGPRRDEIGVAERELERLQSQLTALLQERSRLASIGLAVSKINHDLRNMLSSAQLVSDRLSDIPDPTVQMFAPRLMRALDRAIGLCFDILNFGKTEEIVPEKTAVPLAQLVADVFDNQLADSRDGIVLRSEVPDHLTVRADRDHLYRILNNLVRNAFEALQSQPPQSGGGVISIAAFDNGSGTTIRVSDNGPGVPGSLRQTLFQPFRSGRKGGAGLGLVIAAELVRAHGGDIHLEDTPAGASFVFNVPA
jgi:signal transduction histidine kinase